MNNKDRLQMYVSLTKITIVLCWLSLFSFWAIKLFGGNWFEIMVENENFVEFSNKVQNTWLKYLVSFFTIGIAKYLTFCAICQKFTFKGKHLLIVLSLIVSIWGIVNFIPVEFLQISYGYIIRALIGGIYQKGWKKLFGFVGIISEFAFSSISMIARNVELKFVTNYLVIMILLIDVYIMIALYYLYSNIIRLKKEI